MAHSNADLVRDAIGAFQRGDLDALRHQYFAEDIRYHIPGRSPLAGDYDGVAQVLEMFGRLAERSGGTLRAELHDVMANDEHAAALVTIRGERAGRRLQDNTVLTSISVMAGWPRSGVIRLTCMPWMSSGRKRPGRNPRESG